jgi:hypothetical protein
MTSSSATILRVGDPVEFTDSDVEAEGTVVEELQDDYVRVQWSNSRFATTHRRHALKRTRSRWPGLHVWAT